jgi:histidinol-phosphate/aromatic aminotransferase/cobyric acid decarboxylase-like protein
MNDVSRERQGGDLRDCGPVQLDLSTCVNPYGPSDAVLAALRSMPASAVRMHPYGAAHEVESAYAEYTDRHATEFIAGRGASDLIWSLAQQLEGKTVGLPMPSYTEFRQAFPHARPFGCGPSTHPVEVLDEAMQACNVVIISNPNNPTSQFIQRDDLVGVACRHPESVLVVDESYIDFLTENTAVTLVGCEADNVIVLRSPSKFFGLAGVRSGVAWSLRPQRAQWEHRRTNWPVSAFAAQALRTALAERVWAAEVRQVLRHDVAWLEGCLAQSGLDITPGSLHFRLLTGPGKDIAKFADTLSAAGISVRVLGEAYGVGSPAIRISSPRRQQRSRLDAALSGS